MPTLTSENLRQALIAQATELGFDDIGITTPDQVPHAQTGLSDYLAAGHHGQMAWMAERTAWRGNPNALWPEAKSIIMLAANYTPAHDPLEDLARKDRAAISVYARNRDYHDLVKKRLKRLARWLVEESGAEVKVFVDTAPVMEKPLAAAAGLGWQGKHTNMVSRHFGSWVFLGSIFTTVTLPADKPHQDQCGSCQACLDICPTKAFPAPHEIDARRCISYLTIEHKGVIAREFRRPMGNRIYGCDDCLAVCPWNKFASRTQELAFQPRAELQAPRLAELAALDDAAFRTLFSGSPIKRIGRNRFVRNVMIAIGNSGAGALIPTVLTGLADEAPEVRAMAVWALGELDMPQALALSAGQMAGEVDVDVKAEWQALG